MNTIEKITHNNSLLAIIIYSSFEREGINFFTDDDSPQQVGYMKREEGYEIQPHRHNLVKREVFQTQEVLLVKSGKIRVDLYDDSEIYVISKILSKGDIILLASGGHGFKMIVDSEIVEIKQGPYLGERDKVRFTTVDDLKIQF